MLALLNPAALLALAGLLVPVAIHLWNRRPGREVAVGSLRWLAAGANRRLRNLKPEQLWLLLLRAALLAVLAVAVAGPVWRTAQSSSRGVVLLSPEAASLPALAGLKPTIDSLRRRGYALHWLAPDFPRVPGKAWQQLKAGEAGATTDSIAALAAGQAFAWARVQQATAVFPGQPLYVVTSAALRNFGGSHALLPAAVTWQALPDTTTTSWVGAAELVGDSLQLLVGHSSETRTTYQRKKVPEAHNGQPFRVPGLATVRFQPDGKGGEYLVIVPADRTAKPIDQIGVDVVPKVIEIYASPEYAADARYLQAGLRAAGGALPIVPQLRQVKTRPDGLHADWVFWLSDEPLPPGWREDMASSKHRIWVEAAAPGRADTAHLATNEPGAAAVAVFRRGGHAAFQGGETVWADGQGRAILARQTLGRGNVYQLHTRLHPAWSTLADDPQLPARLLELLQPEPTDNFGSQQTRLAEVEAAHDRRALAPAQLPAVSATPAVPASTLARPATFRQTDLRPWLVLLVGLLLLLERLLARRRETLAQSVNL
ncbi:BatA domain-containing protein [Hymenobacter sp. DH14]|uniref:BatA domain-containing protein n=1 Tax=Hymenobacter cyanobacteriorum TaxID=2926463 RepID=A0A9X2AES8_9BACT|nr:BatA domain-containing protein [Hymenobacter cyanobacteriorum]MCI1187132.1 BatA domain-containing protein [Hymenobacter cyanobacteriorum]